MWGYKSCPRCHGDVFIDEDIEGRYIKCLQCGYEKEASGSLFNNKIQNVITNKAGVLPLACGTK